MTKLLAPPLTAAKRSGLAGDEKVTTVPLAKTTSYLRTDNSYWSYCAGIMSRLHELNSLQPSVETEDDFNKFGVMNLQ
ncbi:hypothetical protein VTI74DRAFT_9084 [Chaetomium olivicolor]